MKNYLENLLQECESELTKEVIKIALDNIDDYENPIDYFTDIMEHGCISGIVTELIYYYQTEEFFNRHVDEILEIYNETLAYVDTDMEINRNNLAWFAFEEAIKSLYYDFIALEEEE